MPPQLQWHCPRSELQVWQDKGRSRKDITHGPHPGPALLQVYGGEALPWGCSLLPGGWRVTCCRTLIVEGESEPLSGRRRLTAPSSGDNSGG